MRFFFHNNRWHVISSVLFIVFHCLNENLWIQNHRENYILWNYALLPFFLSSLFVWMSFMCVNWGDSSYSLYSRCSVCIDKHDSIVSVCWICNILQSPVCCFIFLTMVLKDTWCIGGTQQNSPCMCENVLCSYVVFILCSFIILVF